MDTKQLLTTMALIALAMLGYWYFFGNKPSVETKSPTPSILAGPATTEPAYAPATAPATARAVPWAAADTRTLGGDRPPGYSGDSPSGPTLAIVVSNVNAGIDSVKLNHYDESTTRRVPMQILTAPDAPGALRPFATVGITIDDVYYGPTRNDVRVKKLVAVRVKDDSKDKFHTELHEEWHSVSPATSPATPADNRFIWQFVPPDPQKPNEVRLRHLWYAADGVQVLVQIDKIFQLVDEKSYGLIVTHEISNKTARDITVKIDQLGPTDLANDSFQVDQRNCQAVRYNTAHHYIDGGSPVIFGRPALQKASELPKPLGDFQGTDPLVWVAASDRFFTAIVRPIARPENPSMTAPAATTPATHAAPVAPETAPASGVLITPVDFLEQAQIEEVMAKTLKDKAEPDRTTAIVLAGKDVIVHANKSTRLALDVFLGPKTRALLGGDATAGGTSDYARYQYISTIRFNQNTCPVYSYCLSDQLAQFILGALDVIHIATFHNYGIAIMVLVLVVRLLMHPLTRYSQVNMAKMQKAMAAIQPEIEKVKKKYEKDKARQQQELMQVYKDHKVNPAGGIMGCLPMLLQMPIWIALYAGLAVDIDLRHAHFIHGWINDLSNPDTLTTVNTPWHIPFIGVDVGGSSAIALNLLPILLGVVFYFQMRLTNKTMPKAADPQQAQTQKISSWMIMIFPIFLYNAPSGLNLYIFASTVGGLLDSWLVRRHMRKQGILPAVAPK